MRSKLRVPSPGTALGLLALIVALAGNADAFSKHTLVRKGDIAKGAVTAKTIAPGAVKAKALGKGSVSSSAIKDGAVAQSKLGSNAVTAAALAPGSVYGGALNSAVIHSATILDTDSVPSNPEWTASAASTAICAPGERLLSGGVVFTQPGNREVTILASQPFENGGTSGWIGRISSNSGGTATAEVQAICLK